MKQRLPSNPDGGPGIVMWPELEEVIFDESFITIFAGGEGSSKSFSAGVWGCAMLIYLLARNGLEDVRNDEGLVQQRAVSRLGWIIGVTYEDAFREFKYLVEFAQELDLIDNPAKDIHIRDNGDQKCSFVTKYGQLVETISGSDATRIGREQPDFIIGSEVSRWSGELWNRVHGRLERRSRWGARGYLTGSFESSVGAMFSWWTMGQGPNDAGVRSFSVPTWTNPVLYPEGLDDPAIRRLQGLNSEARFQERYGGKPAPPRNAVLPEANAALHIDPNIAFDDRFNTYIFVDPGELVYAVLVVQENTEFGEVWVLDELYVHRGTHSSVIADLRSREGWRHTARTRRVVIDVAGFQRHAGDSPADVWRKETNYWVSGSKYAVETTVDRLRAVLGVASVTGRPRLRIHPRCKGLISEMGMGEPPYASLGIGGVWSRFSENGRPKKENDHACKALGYGLQEIWGQALPAADVIRNADYFDHGNDGDASYLQPAYGGWSVNA